MFAMYVDGTKHFGNGRPSVWIKAEPGVQEEMVSAAPACFFVPPYVGVRGWVGVWLDGVVDSGSLADLLKDAYRLVAPRKLSQLLDARDS
jgi:predicted DNA-binding protein (MmcQ/YjbR family)